jgi:alcohol dehydrogenase class IV
MEGHSYGRSLYLQRSQLPCVTDPVVSHMRTIPKIVSPVQEYTVGAGFTDDSGVKVSVSSQELAPAGIILDAELTLSTPDRLWYVM